MNSRIFQKLMFVLKWVKKNVKFDENNTISFDLIMKKLIHYLILTSDQLHKTILVDFIEFITCFENLIFKGKSGPINYLEYYGDQVRKKILKNRVFFEYQTQEKIENNNNLLTIAPEIITSAINNHWIIVNLCSKDYPFLQDYAIYEEFNRFYTEHLQIKDLDFEDVDKLRDIKQVFENSINLQSRFKEMFSTTEFKEKLVVRLKNIKESSLGKKKSIRNEIIETIKNSLLSFSCICSFILDNCFSSL